MGTEIGTETVGLAKSAIGKSLAEDACSFDAGCFKPELSGADGRSISADPAADNHHVIVRFGKLHLD